MEFSEGLKKIFLAGVGAAAMTADAAKDLVDQLVKKGELTVEQGKVLNEELKHNVKNKVNDHVTVNIIKEYKDVLKAVDQMSEEELKMLREKLEKAEAAKKEETLKSSLSDTEKNNDKTQTSPKTEEAPKQSQESTEKF